MNFTKEINEILHLCGIQINEYNVKHEDAMNYTDSVEDIPYDEFSDKFRQDNVFDENILKQEILAQNLRKILHSLTPREEYIVRSYFGIDCEKMNYIQIGQKLGISGSRVGQILEKAIRKCRHPSRIRKLIDYDL